MSAWKNNIQKHKNIIVFVSVFVALLFVDLLTKWLTNGFEGTVIPGFLNFTSFHNPGIAFGLLAGQRVLVLVVNSLLIVGAFVAWWFFARKDMALNVALAIFLAGAVGNHWDRIFYGHVRDFIDFSFTMTVMNLADVFLTIGTVLVIIAVLVQTFRKEKPTEEEAVTDEA